MQVDKYIIFGKEIGAFIRTGVFIKINMVFPALDWSTIKYGRNDC